MTQEVNLPTTIDELIEWLDEVFPDKIVTAELSAYEQGKQHGVIETVRYIKQLREALNNEDN